MPPEGIRLGALIRQMEREIILVGYLDPETNSCPLAALCQLRVALGKALAASFAVPDRCRPPDLIRQTAAPPLRGLAFARCQEMSA